MLVTLKPRVQLNQLDPMTGLKRDEKTDDAKDSMIHHLSLMMVCERALVAKDCQKVILMLVFAKRALSRAL